MNIKAQGMVIDLIMLILIASVFFIIVGSQMSHQASDAGVIRSKSMQIQRTLISLLNSHSDNNTTSTTHTNATVAELIGEKYCTHSDTFDDLNATVQKAMKIINKPDYYFILTFCPEDDCSGDEKGVCSPEIGKCCIKTENINVAKLKLNLPPLDSCSYDYATVQIGIWPKSMEVETCD